MAEKNDILTPRVRDMERMKRGIYWGEKEEGKEENK